MFNPCYEHCFLKYGRQYSKDCDNKCEYAKVIVENKALNKVRGYPVHNIYDVASKFCMLSECENCPVHIYHYEKRTQYEKENLHEPCCSNLYKWFIEEVQKHYMPKKRN